MDEAATLIPVTALKHWLYCRRLVHYQYGIGLEIPPTAKMAEGRAAQKALEKLELRRGLARYGVEGRARLFRPYLTSPALGLSGIPDLLLSGEAATAVVEFKLTAVEPNESHWIQLAAYAALVEETREERVDQVMLYRIPDGLVVRKLYHAGWRVRLEQVVSEVWACLECGRLPPAPGERDRCTDCEYANFCGDVW